MKFGEKLADARKTARLTQEELAKILGLSKRTIINYEVKGLYPRNRDIYYRDGGVHCLASRAASA